MNIKKKPLIVFFCFIFILCRNLLFACQDKNDSVIVLNINMSKDTTTKKIDNNSIEKDNELIQKNIIKKNKMEEELNKLLENVVDKKNEVNINSNKKNNETNTKASNAKQNKTEDNIEASNFSNKKDLVDSATIIKEYIKDNNIPLTPTFEALAIPVQPKEGFYEFKFSIYEDARLLYDSYQIYAELADISAKNCDENSKLKLFATYVPCKNARIDKITNDFFEECNVDDNLRFLQDIRPNRSYITIKFDIGLLNYIGFFECHVGNSLFNNNSQDYWNDRAFKIKIRGIKVLNNGTKIFGPYSNYRFPPIKLACGVSNNH